MVTKKVYNLRLAVSGIRNCKFLLVFAILVAATVLRAQTWNDGVGDWFFYGNWTPPNGPTANSVVTVANGGTAQVAGATANAGDLTIGSTSSVAVAGWSLRLR